MNLSSITVFKTLLCLLPLLVVTSARAEIYQWTDSHGSTHFSDNPRSTAKIISLNTPAASTAPAQTKSQPPTHTATIAYTIVQITQPQHEETIHDNQGNVSITTQIEPELKSEDRIQLLLDGQAIGAPQSTLAFSLENIDRGTHTLLIQIRDKTGKILQVSQPVTFFMHRTLLKNNL